MMWFHIKAAVFWGNCGSADNLRFVQLLCFSVISSRKWSDTVYAPYVLKFRTKPCLHFDYVIGMGFWSLIVSVRLNDSTYWTSSMSAHMLTFESAQTCTHTCSYSWHICLQHFPCCASLPAWFPAFFHVANVHVSCHCDIIWPYFSHSCLWCLGLWTKDVLGLCLLDLWGDCLSGE